MADPATLEALHRQVLVYLEVNGLAHWEQDETLQLRFSSALLEVEFLLQGTQHIVALRAPVLTDVDPLVSLERVLDELNQLNQTTHFGKWVYYTDERLIALEYDLLGDHLQEDEVMTAVATIARLADAEDDRLQALLQTGRKAFED